MARKRFIADAVCPHCKARDTLRWWEENQVEHVECVSCGHSDQQLPKAMEEKMERKADRDNVIGVFTPE
uniref:YheV family putative zinc ribbon protein n=1 Tax=Thaumasiovibrio occultus TaxID=1891184 RepID=UPI000B34B5B9|nr:YheV family putative zinc ribbon protein [Thaumasiovibrio occultus]